MTVGVRPSSGAGAAPAARVSETPLSARSVGMTAVGGVGTDQK